MKELGSCGALISYGEMFECKECGKSIYHRFKDSKLGRKKITEVQNWDFKNNLCEKCSKYNLEIGKIKNVP